MRGQSVFDNGWAWTRLLVAFQTLEVMRADAAAVVLTLLVAAALRAQSTETRQGVSDTSRPFSSGASETRRVVLLYDERTDLPGLAILDAGLVQSLTSGPAGSVDVYREAMDLSRFGSDTHLQLLRDYLRAKYAAKKIDVVVAAMGPALDFLLSQGDPVFPGTPIVFCGIDRREIEGRALPSHVTGVLVKREFSPTLEVALRSTPTPHAWFSSEAPLNLIRGSSNRPEGSSAVMKIDSR